MSNNDINEEENEYILRKSVYEYLVLNYNQMKSTHVYYKLIGAVTAKQVALAVGLGDKTDHFSLSEKVISEIGPGDYNYWRNFNRENVTLAAYENFFGIQIPSKINYQQYKVIEDVINQVRQFEKDYNIKIKSYPELEETLEEAKRKLNDWVYVQREEKIVGIPINEQYLIDSINRELNIENCKDIKDLREVARIISKYYHDNFFKDIIIKLVPNAEKISYLFGELFGFDRYINDISFNIDDFSYENIEQCLQRIILEAEKKREAENFDMMYNEALRDNEEFDRKKKEELREYSEMYEQALKDNEEFDRKKEEEKHQSLIEKEAQSRTDWKNEPSSYNLYQNYKTSIKERLEFEKAKEEFDNISRNQFLETMSNELDNSTRIK